MKLAAPVQPWIPVCPCSPVRPRIPVAPWKTEPVVAWTPVMPVKLIGSSMSIISFGEQMSDDADVSALMKNSTEYFGGMPDESAIGCISAGLKCHDNL